MISQSTWINACTVICFTPDKLYIQSNCFCGVKKPSHNQTNIWHVNLNTLDWFPYFLLTNDGTQVLPKTINVRDDNTVLQQDYFIYADIQPKAGELQSNDISTPWNLQNLLCCFHLDFV